MMDQFSSYKAMLKKSNMARNANIKRGASQAGTKPPTKKIGKRKK